MATISSIIPAIHWWENLDRLLKKIVESAIFQDVILVDNSEDGHIQQGHNLSRVTCVREKRKGVSYARNTWLGLINSEFVYFFDEDIILSEDFFSSLAGVLLPQNIADIVGWKVLVAWDPKIILPKEYAYLFWEKDLWDKSKMVMKTYFWWCNLIFRSSLLKSVWGFPIEFWHGEHGRGLNEDVYAQELIVRRWGSMSYEPGLLVFHPWNWDEGQILERLKMQWKYDRLLDKKINRRRLFLRFIKYNIYIFLYSLAMRFGYVCKDELGRTHMNYIRYKNYVRN